MQTAKKPVRFAALLLCTLLLSAMLSVPASASEDDSSSSSSSGLTTSQIKEQIAQKEKELAATKKEAERLKGQIAANRNAVVNAQKLQQQHQASIQATEEVILLKVQYIEETTEAINVKMAEITQKEEEFERNEERLIEILVAIYEINNQDPLAMFAGVESLSDLLVIIDYSTSISSHYTEELKRILGIKEDLQNRKAELEVDLANLQEEKAGLEIELEEYQALLAEAKQKESWAIQQMRENQAAYNEALAAVEAYQKALEELIKSLPTSSGKPFVGGELTWPVPSHNGEKFISSYYGNRMLYGRANFHKGIDIATQGGEPISGKSVVAALGGTVIYVDNAETTGYGKYLILDHGGGIRTVYAHCSAIYVSQGSSVSQGDSIAAVGNTGNSTGPHLHFEIRYSDSVYVNPLSFFRGEDSLSNYIR